MGQCIPMGRKCKMSHFPNSTKKFKFIYPLFQKIRIMKCVWGRHLQIFNIRLKPICNWYEKFWTQYSTYENYALFCKTPPINCTFQTNGMHWTIQITNTAAYFAEMKEKHQQLLSAKGVGSLHWICKVIFIKVLEVNIKVMWLWGCFLLK